MLLFGDSPGIPTPTPVMTAPRKKLALSNEASNIQPSASSEDGARFGPCD